MMTLEEFRKSGKFVTDISKFDEVIRENIEAGEEYTKQEFCGLVYENEFYINLDKDGKPILYLYNEIYTNDKYTLSQMEEILYKEFKEFL